MSEAFELGPCTVDVATEAGPRILGYARPGGPQLFASLPGEVIEHPAIGEYRFLGGHRLWRAPEAPAMTYHPDDHPVILTETGDGLSVEGRPEPDGLVKTITLLRRGSFTVVEHELRNDGREPITCAPWAITQLRTGGTAFLPQSREPVDQDGVLPNRALVLWPYTDLAQPEIELGSEDVTVNASGRATKAKVGYANRRGWVAYLWEGELFVKWSQLHRDGEEYADMGASVQCYRDERFLELETLGPLGTLMPGQQAVHREAWMLLRVSEDEVDDVLGSLPSAPNGLEP